MNFFKYTKLIRWRIQERIFTIMQELLKLSYNNIYIITNNNSFHIARNIKYNSHLSSWLCQSQCNIYEISRLALPSVKRKEIACGDAWWERTHAKW